MLTVPNYGYIICLNYLGGGGKSIKILLITMRQCRTIMFSLRSLLIFTIRLCDLPQVIEIVKMRVLINLKKVNKKILNFCKKINKRISVTGEAV